MNEWMKFSYNRKDGYWSSRVNVSFLTIIVMNKREREEEEKKKDKTNKHN